MTAPSVTYPSFTSGALVESAKLNQNNADIITAMTDGTKTLTIGTLIAANAVVQSATTATSGMVTNDNQTLAGVKTFQDGIISTHIAATSFYSQKGTKVVASGATEALFKLVDDNIYFINVYAAEYPFAHYHSCYIRQGSNGVDINSTSIFAGGSLRISSSGYNIAINNTGGAGTLTGVYSVTRLTSN